MEDFLINTLGGFSGYIVCTAICERKTNRRKAVVSIVTLCLTLALCLIGIYAVGDNEKQLPDGLSAVENSIAEINVWTIQKWMKKCRHIKKKYWKDMKSCLLQFVIALTSNNFSFLCGLYEGGLMEQAIRKWRCDKFQFAELNTKNEHRKSDRWLVALCE